MSGEAVKSNIVMEFNAGDPEEAFWLEDMAKEALNQAGKVQYGAVLEGRLLKAAPELRTEKSAEQKRRFAVNTFI